MRLVLLGVGHVFDLGHQIRHVIAEERPGAVCIELDPSRFESLMSGPAGTRQVPTNAPSAYKKLAKFQEEMAEHFGAVEVGGEMRVAAEAADAVGAEAVLIDDDAQSMVDRIGKEMRFVERLRFMWEMLRLRFSKTSSARIQEEVRQLEEDPEAMIRELGKKFPTVKRVLLDERDERMAERIRGAVERHDRVVAVLGDGHIQGVVARLGDLNPVVHRLRDLRAMTAPEGVVWDVSAGGANVSFRFDQDVPAPWWNRRSD